MAIQQYNTVPARIAKLKGEIIGHAVPVEVLGITGQQKQMPKNNSDTVVFRRYLPYGGNDNQWINAGNVDTFASAHQTTEGVTPAADTLSAVDVTATLQQYAVLYAVTDKVVDLYEDDIPAEMKRQTGERLGLVREMVRFGALKAATNVFYAGGTSRATVSATITLPLLRKVARTLQANHAKQVTSILAPSPNYATAPIEAAYLVFCHSDLEPAIRDLPGYKGVHEYGSRKPIHPQELGSVERFRFIISPELAQYADAGAATTTATGLESTSGTNIDVYPIIVVGEDAWGQVALRGENSLDVTYIPPGSKDKNDPLGQRGYIGAKTYFAALVLNQGWMAVVEAGAPVL